MAKAKCPVCGNKVEVPDSKINSSTGETFSEVKCEKCGAYQKMKKSYT